MNFRTLTTYAACWLLTLTLTTAIDSFGQNPNTYGVQVGYGYSVGASLLKGDTMFIGGDFDYVGFNTSSLVGVDAGTAAVNQSFPFTNRAIRTMIPDGSGGYFIGGDFSLVNGYKRVGLAHIKSDKSLDLAWNINVNDGAGIYALLLSPTKDTLYVGGNFTDMGGVTKDKVAAIKVSTRSLINSWWSGSFNSNWWAPAVVCALAYYPGKGADPAKLFVGGDFSGINWITKSNLAALNPVTGAFITTWRADLTPCNGTTTFTPVSPVVRTLLVTDNVFNNPTLYIGGLFTNLTDNTGSFARHSLAATEVQGNGTFYNTCTANIQPQNDSGVVNCIRLVKTAMGVWRMGIAGKYRAVRGDAFGYGLQNFTLTDVNGYPSNFASSGLLVNGRVSDTTFIPGVYASGEVYTFDTSGTHVFLGGDFEGIMAAGSTVQVRRNLAALDMATNTIKNWFPIMQTNQPVRALIVNGTEVMAGGSFCSAGGELRRSIAAVNLRLGTILPFNPKPDSYVNDFELSVTRDTLYVGGNFTNVGPAQRGYTAAFNINTGALLPWQTTIGSGGGVEDLELDAARNILYAGGKFTALGGKSRNHLAALNARTGNVINNWVANVTTINGQYTPVRSIALSATGDTVFIGGRFNVIAGQNRANLAALTTKLVTGPADTTALLLAWNFPVIETTTTPDVGVNAVTVDNGRLYIGGKFASISGNTAIQNLAAINISVQPNILDGSWHPAIAYGGINCIVPVNGFIYIGGDFGSVNGIVTSYAAAVTVADGSTVSAWKPYPTRAPFGGTILTMLVHDPWIYVGGSQENMQENINDAVFHLATVQTVGALLPATPPRLMAPVQKPASDAPVRAWMINRHILHVVTPADGYILQLFTVGGQCLQQQRLKTGASDIALQHAPAGVYIYVLQQPGKRFTGKLLVP